MCRKLTWRRERIAARLAPRVMGQVVEVRVREGEVLNLQVDGYAVRYVVESIRSREIVLRDGETVHNLKISIGS